MMFENKKIPGPQHPYYPASNNATVFLRIDIGCVDMRSRRNHEDASRKPRSRRWRSTMPSTGVALQRALPANGVARDNRPAAAASSADDVIAVQQSLSVRPSVASLCSFPRRRPFDFRRARIVITVVETCVFKLKKFHTYNHNIVRVFVDNLSIFVRF